MPRPHTLRRREVLLMLSGLVLMGCETPGLPGGMQAIPYSEVGKPELWTDPQTGKRILITHWRYADGYTTVTIDDVPPTGNDVRRTSEPPIRFAD